MIEQTRFRSTVFLCREFKLENIYSEVDFYGKSICAIVFICGNLFLRIAGKTAKIAKIKTPQTIRATRYIICQQPI